MPSSRPTALRTGLSCIHSLCPPGIGHGNSFSLDLQLCACAARLLLRSMSSVDDLVLCFMLTFGHITYTIFICC